MSKTEWFLMPYTLETPSAGTDMRTHGGDGEPLGCENTDREIWREREGDYYADSIHVTKEGSIGFNVGGTVIVMPHYEWHALAAKALPAHKWKS